PRRRYRDGKEEYGCIYRFHVYSVHQSLLIEVIHGWFPQVGRLAQLCGGDGQEEVPRIGIDVTCFLGDYPWGFRKRPRGGVRKLVRLGKESLPVLPVEDFICFGRIIIM